MRIVQATARVKLGVMRRRAESRSLPHQHGDEPVFHTQMSFLYAATPLGSDSLFVVIIASLTDQLILNIETGARMAHRVHGVVRRLRCWSR